MSAHNLNFSATKNLDREKTTGERLVCAKYTYLTCVF
jgi:hypothetical protein